jgi:hypothetical protein
MSYNAKIKLQHPCLLERSDRTRLRGFGWSSGNWSGYALSGSKKAYRRISANWIVPFVRPYSGSSYSSAWIGIDGFSNNNLIQTGTGHDFTNGKAQYYAWWEILPASVTVIPLPVHPGDHIRAIITKRNRSKWLICLRNLTRNWTFHTLQRYNGPETSAEWIVEAPQVDDSISRLARISPIAFTCYRVNGKNPKLTPAEGGVMIQNNIVVSIPSRPNRTGDAFVVKGKAIKRPAYVYTGKPLLKSRKT